MTKDFAVITTGGKQYKVSAGEKLTIEKLEVKNPASVIFSDVLLRSVAGNMEVGAPYIKGASVEAKLIGDFKDKTKIIFKYHSKTRQRKKKGHRQPHTEVEIIRV